jgi:hypothetical protein
MVEVESGWVCVVSAVGAATFQFDSLDIGAECGGSCLTAFSVPFNGARFAPADVPVAHSLVGVELVEQFFYAATFARFHNTKDTRKEL